MKWIKDCINKIIHHHKRYEPLSLNHDGTSKTYHHEYIAFWK
jgi:hypothetical protein